MKAIVLALTSLSLLSGCVVYANVSDGGDFANNRELQHETRKLTLDITDINEMNADTGAGSLEVIGEAGRTRIDVVAEVYYRDAGDIQLSLEKKGRHAVLTADFARNSYRGDNPYINLTVRVPAELSIDLNDGSGSIVLRDVMGDLAIEDGSGGIEVRNVGDLNIIESGSGSLRVEGVGNSSLH